MRSRPVHRADTASSSIGGIRKIVLLHRLQLHPTYALHLREKDSSIRPNWALVTEIDLLALLGIGGLL
jgi:hypothetical protein